MPSIARDDANCKMSTQENRYPDFLYYYLITKSMKITAESYIIPNNLETHFKTIN